MNERVKNLVEEFRKLSPDEQAELMDLLVAAHDPEIDETWGTEIDRRVAQIEQGDVTLVDAREALRKYKQP